MKKRLLAIVLMLLWSPVVISTLVYISVHICVVVPILWVITGEGLIDENSIASNLTDRIMYVMRFPLDQMDL